MMRLHLILALVMGLSGVLLTVASAAPPARGTTAPATPQSAPATPVVPTQPPGPAPTPGVLPFHGRPPSDIALRQGLAKGRSITLFTDLRDDQGNALLVTDKYQIHVDIGPYPLRIDSVAAAGAVTGLQPGLAAIFLVDISRSVTDVRFVKIREALTRWTDNLGPNDRIAIVTFGDAVTTLQDFSGNMESLKNLIATLKPTDSHTRLYDALLRGLDLGQRQDADIPAQRIIVLLSDGLDDTMGGASAPEVFSAMESSPLPVFAIGFDPGGTAALRDSGFRTLGTLARNSGGEFMPATDDRLTDTYASLRQRVRESLIVQGQCDTCPPDGRVYPVQLSFQDGSRIITGTGHIRLMAGSPATDSAAHPPWLERMISWLPERIRPYWGGLVAILLSLIALGVLLMFMRKRTRSEIMPVFSESVSMPPYPEPPPVTTRANDASTLAAEAVTRAQSPAWSVKEEDPGLRIRLSVVEGTRKGHSWGVMLQEQTTIGRSSSNDVVLNDDPEVSGRHCVLVRERDRIFVQDNQSTNGTFVNGVEINARYLLEDGDVLGIGRTALRLNLV
jgi:Mg-chelatase subunit ChlD